MRRFFPTLIVVLALAVPAFAQQASEPATEQAKPPAANKAAPQIESYGDWVVRCFPIKSVSPCDMLFETVRKGTKVRVTSLSVANIPSRDVDLVQIAVPFGIALDKGVVARFGSYSSGPLPIRRCDRTGCYVEMTAAPDFIDGLKSASGGSGSLTVVADGTEKPVTLALSLKGVGDAYGMMVKLAKEKAVAAPAAMAAKVPLIGP